MATYATPFKSLGLRTGLLRKSDLCSINYKKVGARRGLICWAQKNIFTDKAYTCLKTVSSDKAKNMKIFGKRKCLLIL